MDTRSPPEFGGEVDAYLPRRGRLPGATLAPFAGFFEESGRYAGSAGFASRAPGTAAYCEVGVRAALFALLHEVHTGQTIPIYDGSLMEWSLQPELPLEQG